MGSILGRLIRVTLYAHKGSLQALSGGNLATALRPGSVPCSVETRSMRRAPPLIMLCGGRWAHLEANADIRRNHCTNGMRVLQCV